MPATETEWGWFYAESDDAEVYYPADSRQDAIDQGVDAFDEQPFFICEARRTALRDDFFSAERVMEEFEEHNEEAWGEDGPEGKVPDGAEKELEEALAATFRVWRQKHNVYRAWCLTDYRNQETIGELPKEQTMSDIVLPTHDECTAAVALGAATALQRFIYENEPAGQIAQDEFRDGLVEVIRELQKGGKEE